MLSVMVAFEPFTPLCIWLGQNRFSSNRLPRSFTRPARHLVAIKKKKKKLPCPSLPTGTVGEEQLLETSGAFDIRPGEQQTAAVPRKAAREVYKVPLEYLLKADSPVRVFCRLREKAGPALVYFKIFYRLLL